MFLIVGLKLHEWIAIGQSDKDGVVEDAHSFTPFRMFCFPKFYGHFLTEKQLLELRMNVYSTGKSEA